MKTIKTILVRSNYFFPVTVKAPDRAEFMLDKETFEDETDLTRFFELMEIASGRNWIGNCCYLGKISLFYIFVMK